MTVRAEASRMAVSDFLNLFRAMSEAERLRALPGLGAGELDILQDAFEDGHLELTFTVESLLTSCRYPSPRPPEIASKVLLPREMIEIMALRYAAGRHIEHQADAIRRPIPEHKTRIVHRARNGSPVYDAIREIDEQQAAADVETWQQEFFADLAAMRALHGGINGNGTTVPG